MKKQLQPGFAVIELVVSVVILAAIAGAGYYVWYGHNTSPPTTVATTGSSGYRSPTTSAPTAPEVNSASDLNSAMAALNQTSISSSNQDSSQLSTETSGF